MHRIPRNIITIASGARLQDTTKYYPNTSIRVWEWGAAAINVHYMFYIQQYPRGMFLGIEFSEVQSEVLRNRNIISNQLQLLLEYLWMFSPPLLISSHANNDDNLYLVSLTSQLRCGIINLVLSRPSSSVLVDSCWSQWWLFITRHRRIITFVVLLYHETFSRLFPLWFVAHVSQYGRGGR